MGEVYDFFLSSYSDYSRVDIVLEFLAFWFGIISVVFAKKQNILVYPTGIICTIITMYLMYKVSLLGHILVNLLYTIISFFGWWHVAEMPCLIIALIAWPDIKPGSDYREKEEEY